MRFLLLLLTVLPLLYGEAAAPRTYAYECNNGTRFTARFDADGVRLFLPGTTVNLPHVPTASGAKYADENITFWTRADEAMLLRRGRQNTSCSVDMKASVWEAAKLDGFDFRAVGNEPGWTLLIAGGGEGLILTTNDGSKSYIFKNGITYEDKRKRRTLIQASTRTHTLNVTLRAQPCSDTMSGETFETAVTVTLDGKRTLRGCGRALH